MAGDGVNSTRANPNDNPRLAGRLTYNLFDTETDWFNSGTYLGKKHILALGWGIDTQNDLVTDGGHIDYLAWTLDMHYDQPFGGGNGLTVQSSFIKIANSPNSIPMTWLAAGDDAYIASLQAGYYFGRKAELGYLQPFAHYENIHVRERSNSDTQIYGLGFNYYLKDVANKMTLEVTVLDHKQEGESETAPRDQVIVTLQFAAGI
jgi:hypothetical protein